ncbi:potassium-transporting ATPase subunit KdpA [Rivihabitans pingtungensis]|jgi:K+-transporting ATPase ATPase A chain|uniref:potassium-transporting ATPase subunit KdpA n=1 Tax=Rivihabitans pingtungensis TaxID=1054498 RepID=UPI002BABDA01|nr:potassium-transporting ATPase subunit KdpA [Rivihabitans pingtungensis]HNX72052.1 potassium-transporting ATPase subunit KdpA [Rivihabitans pingtungensis]
MLTAFFWLLALFMAVLTLSVRPMGAWLAPLASGQAPARLAGFDRALLRLMGVRDTAMDWREYARAVLLFSLLGALLLYVLQRVQGWLPLNPGQRGAVTADSAFNTAVSFVSNTNWQGYAGEASMSHLTQMLGLTVQNFLSAATGIAVACVLMRGFARRETRNLGNFWADLTRISVYLLAPLSLLLALALASQGVVQSWAATLPVATLAGGEQTLTLGPVASQEAIKLLGTNGGGFFNANSAHPFENPNELSNFLQMLAIFLIPAGLCHAFGRVVGDRRQGWALYGAMALLFVLAASALALAEAQGNPLLNALSADASVGSLEGKELRFGAAGSSLFAAVTTAASCGAVNAMHDSLTPLGGMLAMWLMQLGEVVFGGVGSGLYGMLVFAVLAVFVAGLMVGRTPEYLGKKIEAFEMKMVALVILLSPALVLLGSALAVVSQAGLAGLANGGAHGFSEVLYAFSSAANNNGSAFAGLSANTPFYNGLLGAAMWLGRFGVIVPVLALAGALAAKKTLPPSAGAMPTHGGLFIGLLSGAVLMVGALTYLPALALGPMAEHLALWAGR